MAEPTYLSETPAGTDLSAAELGANALSLPLFEQGKHVARVMEARDTTGCPLFPTVVVMMPRRSTKTTAIWNVLIGRCLTRPGHKVVTTAQDGTRARLRWREVARTLDASGFEDQGLGKIRWSNGDESFEFSNGSRLWVVAPNAAAFRGEAADDILFDESGEYSLDKSDDLVAGALPLMDTRPQGQVIIAGTPGKARAGLLWDTLTAARNGDPETGIVDYSIRDSEQAIHPDGTLNEAVLLRVHPGIGTLTTLARMRSRFEKMPLPNFEMEYLCRFPFDNSVSALDYNKWANGAQPFSEKPQRLALAYDVAPDGSTAALVAAWRDETGNAVGAVVEYKHGWQWVADRAAKEAAKYDRAPIAYDVIGANQAVAEALGRIRPNPRLQPKTMREMMAAAAVVHAEVEAETVRQFDQSALDEAVKGAAWRDVGGASGRLFARKSSTNDVAPLVAFSAALHAYDAMPARTSTVLAFGD